MTTATAAVPDTNGILVVVNDPTYGGSGGFNYAVSYNGAHDGHEVATHELGHALVGLWDEYSYGYDQEGSGPNCAVDPGGDWEAQPEAPATINAVRAIRSGRSELWNATCFAAAWAVESCLMQVGATK